MLVEANEQLIELANGDEESDLVAWSLLLLAATVLALRTSRSGFPIATITSLAHKDEAHKVTSISQFIFCNLGQISSD